MTTTWRRTIATAAGTGAPASDQYLAEELLQEALEQHWARVCRTLYHLVGDWSEAEDLAIEVFLRLHHHPPRDLERVSAWLYRVASNAGLNALRARKRRQSYETAAGQWTLQQQDPIDPVTELERRQDQAQVRAVLAAMRPRQAQLLFLRYLGLSYAELARVLEMAPGSVGTMLARAERAFERRYRAVEDKDATPK